MPTAAAYIRVSTEDQMEFSPDSQLRSIQAYALNHHIELLPAHIYLDEGISGRNASKRPAFLQMIADAQKKPHPFDLILLWKFSRFARNRQDSIFYKSMLRRECGIDVISITEPLSPDPTSILIEALLEAMDEYYSVNLAQEVRRGMNEKFRRGGIVSIPPFGYTARDGQFIIVPEQACWVRRIFDSYLNGISIPSIAKELQTAGVRTIRGNPFDGRGVRYILGNPVYTGQMRRHLEHHTASSSLSSDRFHMDDHMTCVVGTHPPIISRKIFLQTQTLLMRTKKKS